MATAEIESTDWKAFCEKFLKLQGGTLMSIVKIEPSGRRVETVRDMPLTGMWFKNGECNDSIFLRLEQEGKREITHEIIDPIRVKIREEGEGKKELQIDGENGSTLVLFQSGKLKDLLNGLHLSGSRID